MRASRILRVAGLLIAAGAVTVALLPFHVGLSSPGLSSGTRLESACGRPFTELTRTPTRDTGWFGYAPGAVKVIVPGHGGCAGAARERLGLSLAGFGVAGLLAIEALLMDRGHGFAWRRRLQPAR